MVVYELAVSGNAAITQTTAEANANSASGPTMTSPSSTNVPTSGSSAAVADQIFAEPTLLPNSATAADQSAIASLAAMLQQDDASTVKRLDSLLSIEAGAMGLSKDTLMRDFLLASRYSSNDE